MAAVFVHGIPDTYRLWNDLRAELNGVQSLALALPGFDTQIPQGFAGKKENYVDWIIDELKRQTSPVDLVGHDWGCIFALRVASLRPDLIRTLAVGSGPLSKDYEWHQLAKTWQTPGAGEKFMKELSPQALSDLLQGLGVPPRAASDASEHLDDRMKDCILKLYRSAIHVGEEWQPSLSQICSPTRIFWGQSDEACPIRFAHEMAMQLQNGHVAEIDCGHWVPLEKPAQLASILEQHWNQTDA